MNENGLKLENFKAGECIFKEGTPADSAYMITNGEVEISKEKHGERIVLATKKQGDVFGEMALIEQSERSATATAASNTVCYRLDEQYFLQELDGLHPFMRGIFKKLSGIVRRQTDTVALVEAADRIKEKVTEEEEKRKEQEKHSF